MSLKIRSIQHVLIVIALASSLLSFTAAPAQAAPPTPPTCAQGGPCVVGDIGPGGGKVFYVSSGRFTQSEATGSMCTTNCVYLEVAPSGWSGSSDPTRPWAGATRDVATITNDGVAYNNALGIGLGFKNSNAIINEFGSNNAAGSARAYSGASKTDWYLPTIAELNLLCQWARGVASSETTRCTGGTLNSATYGADSAALLGGNYWSSSERNVNDGWFQSMDGGAQGTAVKWFDTYTRPIRAFAPTVDGLAITRASVGTQRRTAFTTQPQITVKTFDNDTVTASSVVITATISSGGTLMGTTTATASSGTATFSNLSVDGTVGSTYTIYYAGEGLIPISATITLAGTNCDGTSFACQVGDIGPGGGRVFYVSSVAFEQVGATGTMCKTWCKYLEAAPTTGASPWSDTFYGWSGNIDTLIGTTGTAIGTGYKNTKAIIAQSNVANKAASVSQAYRGPNDLTDWFLPSKDELNQLCRWERGNSISDLPCYQGTNNSGIGATGFVENYYWSSSEFSATNAWSQPFAGEPTDFYGKNDTNWARAIRAFGPAPVVVYVELTPVPYLKTLTTPKLNLKDGKLVCTPGTYNAGYTLNGVIQGSATALFTPPSYTYNLLVNGVGQTSLTVTTASAAATWNLSAALAGSLVSCSVTVSANSVTNTDKSSDNASAVSSALSIQTTAIATANADYSTSQSANSKAYQKALVDNRVLWRKQIDAIRANYFDTIARITASDGTKKMIADKSTALKVYITAQKQSAADYKASQPAALAVRDAANKAALATRDAAITKANATYGTFIESIGYGVLIP
jgi:hypothetical protein